MTSVAIKSPGSNQMQKIADNIGQILPYTDILGISSYPYIFFSHEHRGNPANLPANWLSQIKQIAQNKPLAISETGWPGEDLEIADFSYSESSSPANQAAYTEMLLQAADELNLQFVIWWTIADYDTLWLDQLAKDPLAKIWKDTGFFDEHQMPRDALIKWDEWFNREYSP